MYSTTVIHDSNKMFHTATYILSSQSADNSQARIPALLKILEDDCLARPCREASL